MNKTQWAPGDRICGSFRVDDEIRPEIPFAEFPDVPREARPDENGSLAWFVADPNDA